MHLFIQKIKTQFGINAFVFCAMACGFFISADYAIIRPISNSLFLHFYGSELLPYAWLAGVPLSFLAVALYNRFLGKIGCWKMFLAMGTLVVLPNLLSALFVHKIPGLAFFFYVWKEVYIMLMFQQLWSVIHSTIKKEQAKYLYGILFGCGALGGILGSLLPGFFAVQIGSEGLIFATLPLYTCLGTAFFFLMKNASPVTFEKKGDFFQGIKLIPSSKTLSFILTIVVCMQLSATLIDYQFQMGLQASVVDKDLRTELMGRIFSLIHTATFSLQFLGTYLIVRFLGLRLAHFLVPFCLCISFAGYLIFPVFGALSLSYGIIKTFDFSFFGIIKEMLYIPMKPEEKFHAKAVIDVFAYRSSKAVASFLILLFSPQLLPWANISLFAIWCIMTLKYFKEQTAYAQPSDGGIPS